MPRKPWDWNKKLKALEAMRTDADGNAYLPDWWDDLPEGPKKLGFTPQGWLGMVPMDAEPTGQIGFVAGELKDIMPEAVDE